MPVLGYMRGVLPAYVGPGDVISGASAWWGLRAYSLAQAGNQAVRLVRASDSAQQDINTLAGGDIDLVSITTFLSGTTGKVVTLYDQTGNGFDITQATSAARPDFTLNGIFSHPVLAFNADELDSAGNLVVAQPLTLSAVVNNTGTGSQANILLANGGGGGVQLGVRNSANNQVFLFAGSVLAATATDGVWHAFQAVANGASSDMNVDGVSNTGAGGANTSSTLISAGATASTQRLTGNIVEFGIWPVAFSGANSTSMKNNQKAYWGY